MPRSTPRPESSCGRQSTAPARDIGVGAYVANGSGHELFRVARTSPLRIFVNVPQRDARRVKTGLAGGLSLPQFPNRTFRAHVTNTAEVVDPNSLLTELQIPNESGERFPGAYAEITFKFTDDSRFLTIPENTLLFRREGPAVSQVHADGIVFLLIAAGALFIASPRSALTRAINGPERSNSRGGADAGRSGASRKVGWNDTPSVTGSDDALH